LFADTVQGSFGNGQSCISSNGDSHPWLRRMDKLTMTAPLPSKNPSFFLKTLQDLPDSRADNVISTGSVNAVVSIREAD